MVHYPEVPTTFKTFFAMNGKPIACPQLGTANLFEPAALLAGIRRAELEVMKNAFLHCNDLKKWYKQAGGKNALLETDPKYAAAALDGCEMQNTLSLRTQAFA
jgi:hypothetical protein